MTQKLQQNGAVRSFHLYLGSNWKDQKTNIYTKGVFKGDKPTENQFQGRCKENTTSAKN